ncbi:MULTISPECIES: deaminase domain-containing protein [Pseudomonas]|uniref:The BURPS668_1122 family of deaminases n=1 Tax=Pseudomonas quercus TaxID=2722792 RepID=A0ABX0YB72_9PSED|nr:MULTISPECIES: deaminase domain-containing protein [Pseudomonas]MBF7142062.1 hypothetical protein [Pseudomonas sp. LY10J]NJP00600.1 hypothetical protein [Pseudomonas quercus]
MHRPPMRLIDLFAHWRDEPLYELETAISHLPAVERLEAHELRKRRIVTVSFYLDKQGRPKVRRREAELGVLLKRYTGYTGERAVQVTLLLEALRLERERRLRYLLHSAHYGLLSLLDDVEIQKLRALPQLAGGPHPLVSTLLNEAGGQQGAGTLMDYPLTGLLRVLCNDTAQTLLRLFGQTLGWDNEPPRAMACTVHDLALLTLVLPWALDPQGDIHGFDFYSHAMTGLRVSDLFEAMQYHLMPSLAGCTAETFGLIRFLLGSHAPAQLGVLGLPAELAWLTSGSFVLLSQGVALAESITPGAATYLSFADALQLPARLSEVSPDEASANALADALVLGLEHWRRANQRIYRLPALASLASARRHFLMRVASLERATLALEQPMPRRIAMALETLRQSGIDPEMRFVNARDRERQSLFAQAGVSALEAIITGEAAGPAPARVPALVRGHNGQLYEPWCNAVDLPDIGMRFEQAFLSWKTNISNGIEVMVRALTDDLPLHDRLRLERHEVTLYQLAKRPAPDGPPEVAALGMVLQIETNEGIWHYTILPWAGWCQVHRGLHLSYPTLDRNWHLHAEQTLPFDWQAFSRGGVPSPRATFDGWLVPVAKLPAYTSSLPVFRNATAIAKQCALQTQTYLGTFYKQAQGTLTLEAQQGIPEAVKALVPFWSSVETIREGHEEKSSWLVLLGVLGLLADVVTLGTLGRLSALTLRFLSLSLRRGTRSAARALLPRLRSAAREALDDSLANGAGHDAMTPVADVALIAAVRLNHREALRRAARQLGPLSDAASVGSRADQAPWAYPDRSVQRFEDGRTVLAMTGRLQTSNAREIRHVDAYTGHPYGPSLDTVDGRGRLGRLPLALPVITRDGLRYLPDPAPALPKRWIRWGDDTWLECSGRYYRLQEATPTGAATFVQARPPFERPLLKGRCRVARQLPALVCRPSGERTTEPFTELKAGDVVSNGSVEWFDQRKVIPTSTGRFVDSRALQEVRGGKAHVVKPLAWADYYSDISAEIIAGNDIFLRIQVRDGIAGEVADRRLLSAVKVKHIESDRFHLVTCVDDGVYYHGTIPTEAGPVPLRKLPEGNSPHPEALTEADELKLLYTGSWDANIHIRNRGLDIAQDHLEQVEQSIAQGGHRIDLSLLQRYALNTTAAEAAFFNRCQRQSFTLQARRFATSDYTHPLNDQTPEAVRAMVATHLNRLTEPATPFDAQRVLDPGAMADAPPKGKNIAFVVVEYGEGQPHTVYYSGSGGSRRKSELALGKRLVGQGTDPALPWRAEDGTRYISCQGAGGKPGEESLLHLPDLSKPGQLTSGNYNTRQLDSERNILAHLERTEVNLSDVTQATLFTRFPTCESCTTLISRYRQRFPVDRFRVYEGPLPASDTTGPVRLPEQPRAPSGE